MENVLAIVLAGGAGERLFPLTKDTAKPGVPFGGAYRIVDFTLSNCVNSDVRRILILTQYKSLDLTRHIRDGWNIFSSELGEYIEVIPPMKRVQRGLVPGYGRRRVPKPAKHRSGSAGGDAGALRRPHLQDELPRNAGLAPDARGRDHHRNHPGPAGGSRPFRGGGIGEDCRVVGFEEKPQHGDPKRSRFDPSMISASMGVYVFNTEVLLRALREDAQDAASSHDFGKDVIPRQLEKARVVAYDFRDINGKTARYWRDVGTLDAYYEANMDLVNVVPEFNLYDQRWPIRTKATQQPPAKFVFAQEGRRMGVAVDSIVSSGCIVSGGRVLHSVLSPGVRVNSYCEVEYSILMPGVEIGRYSRFAARIVNTGVNLPDSSVVGFDLEADRAKGYHVTEAGIVVVA